MKTIQLPAILPGNLDLTELNQQLRDRHIQLDWSAVVSAAEEHLITLLQGLDLSDHSDVLGIDDRISDSIQNRLSKVFDQLEQTRSQKPSQTSSKKSKKSTRPVPAVWTQPALLETQFVAATSHSIGGQGNLVEMQLVPTHPINSLPMDSAVPILTPLSHYELRDKLETALLSDLLGPAGGDYEELDEARVSDRYLVGLIAPLHRRKAANVNTSSIDDDDSRAGTVDESPEQLDTLSVSGGNNTEDGTIEVANPTSESMLPSSIGLSFCVDASAPGIQITVRWGQYEKGHSETATTKTGAAKTVWKRNPIEGESPVIPLKVGAIVPWQVDPTRAVYVKGQIRKQGTDWIATVFLVNEQREQQQSPDRFWLFQPELIVQSANPEQPDIFIKKITRRDPGKLDAVIYEEEQRMAMLYRNQVEFAVGHSIGVHTDVSKNHPQRAIQLSTRVVPVYEVPQSQPPKTDEIPTLAGLVLDMKVLAETALCDLPAQLQPLTTAYAEWIDQQTDRMSDHTTGLSPYQSIAEGAIVDCRKALQRIQAGIDLLATNPQAAEAFSFLNRAMWEQRVHSLYAEQKRRGEIELTLESIDIPRNRTWRTFQLAFILLNLPSITDLAHPDRIHPTEAVADLLWFPTGGGKTEAYLGLTAYTIGLRRLQGTISGRSGEQGVAVLMRYTLRLLTLQQFQRATALICACEAIRRQDDNKWGQEPFRVGLWVGQKTTPNTTEQSHEILQQAKGSYQGASSGSPHQLTNCPWCGTQIQADRHIHVESWKQGSGRTLTYCGDSLGRCIFSAKQSPKEGLPVVVVDDEIYRLLPTLLIATVDKFAQMPWNGKTQMLFGQVNGYCTRHGFRSPEIDDSDSHPARNGTPAAKTIPMTPLRPPDLIIQDELHLISGPLGTLVGLYETAVDHLCSWEVEGHTVRPKVIASTATIRQAREQIHQLFLREVQIFPPQGLDVTDNFFSRQRSPSAETPGRRYLGICATGRRMKAALIRVYTASLSASQSLFDQGEDVDPWMTLVGYFNSMRELGGTRRLVDDDIQTRLYRMADRGLAKRPNLEVQELTSRIPSTDIPVVLDRLEVPFVLKKEGSKKESKYPKNRPIDVLLATNMISVGVDVRRLGAMIVAGQPKTTAEYIQATSRVGRTHPGLVITVYNWARPRDLSHYEQFEHYHATFYQHVESLSITPFSPGAIQRGLASVLVALIRLSGIEFNKNDRAGRIDRNHPAIQAAMKTILDRAENVEGQEARSELKKALEIKLDYWLKARDDLKDGAELKYKPQADGITLNLLENFGPSTQLPFACLSSLRNVEPTIGLILDNRVPDDDFRIPKAMPKTP